MKNNTFYLSIILLATLGLMFQSCKKDKNQGTENEVVFKIENSDASKSLTKSSLDISDVTKIILTIQTEDGTATKYNNSDLKLYKLNGTLSSEKITLKTGNYKLTFFVLADTSDNILYAAPLQFTAEANLVSISLPISFTVNENGSTIVNVEVISTDEKNPESFGLTSFNISAFYRLYLGITSKELNRPLSAKVTVSSGSYYSLLFFANANLFNTIPVREAFSSYLIKVDRPGYTSFSKEYSYSDLFNSNNKALNIELSLLEPLVIDNEGNTYTAIKLGNQTWLGQNLATAHFNNGDAIPTISYDWDTIPNPNFQWGVGDIGGRFYTWNAIMDSRGICPAGWHIPTRAEWLTLINFLGGDSIAGSKLKEIGGILTQFYNWESSIIPLKDERTNESGLSMLATGRVQFYSTDGENHFFATLWTSTASDPTHAYGLGLNYASKGVGFGAYNILNNGLCVRCLKNN